MRYRSERVVGMSGFDLRGFECGLTEFRSNLTRYVEWRQIDLQVYDLTDAGFSPSDFSRQIDLHFSQMTDVKIWL